MKLCIIVLVMDLILVCKGCSVVGRCLCDILFFRNFVRWFVIICVLVFGSVMVEELFSFFEIMMVVIFFGGIGIKGNLIWFFGVIIGIGMCVG